MVNSGDGPEGIYTGYSFRRVAAGNCVMYARVIPGIKNVVAGAGARNARVEKNTTRYRAKIKKNKKKKKNVIFGGAAADGRRSRVKPPLTAELISTRVNANIARTTHTPRRTRRFWPKRNGSDRVPRRHIRDW